MQLEAGKFYESRSGYKVYIFGQSPFDDHWIGVSSFGATRKYLGNGASIAEPAHNLIEEWREPRREKVKAWLVEWPSGATGLRHETPHGTTALGSVWVEVVEGQWAEERDRG